MNTFSRPVGGAQCVGKLPVFVVKRTALSSPQDWFSKLTPDELISGKQKQIPDRFPIQMFRGTQRFESLSSSVHVWILNPRFNGSDVKRRRFFIGFLVCCRWDFFSRRVSLTHTNWQIMKLFHKLDSKWFEPVSPWTRPPCRATRVPDYMLQWLITASLQPPSHFTACHPRPAKRIKRASKRPQYRLLGFCRVHNILLMLRLNRKVLEDSITGDV